MDAYRCHVEKMYWEQQTDVNKLLYITPYAINTMSRILFEQIIQYLHMCDNTKLCPGDKMVKV